MEEESKHKKFLEAFIDTRSVAEAGKIAGIDNPATLNNYFSKYKNYYKALFEKLEMPEIKILENVKAIAVGADSDRTRLSALELILKLIGAINEANKVEVNVITDEDKVKELKLYTEIQNDAELSDRLLAIISNNKGG